jgi:hypothetical protein
MEEPASKRLVEAIARALAPLQQVQAALLFGSRNNCGSCGRRCDNDSQCDNGSCQTPAQEDAGS